MSCTIPFRIGVTVPSAPTAADWREAARSAEGQGFDVLTVADHLVADCYPPLPALVSAAEVTKTLRVGTLVINNDLRNPVVLAKELATVDDLTGGRLEIGLGAGHGAPEYRAAGIRFDHPGVRVARLAESVEVIDRLLRGETVTFNGVYYQVHEHAVWPRPVQSPRPPILIGGGGLRVHELAARRADIIGFAGTGKTLADDMRAYRERWGLSYFSVFAHSMGEMAKVIPLLR